MSHGLTGAELAATRQRLGLSVEQLAAELGLTPHVVIGMEAGRVAIPRRYSAELAWRLGIMERERGLAESGLPGCAWVSRWQRAEASSGARGRMERLRALQQHTAACPTCVARHQFVETTFGPLPERPIPVWARTVMWVRGHVGKLPPRMRPVAYGALVMALWSILRVVFLAGTLRNAADWTGALIGLLVSIALGALAGAVYGLVNARRR